MAAAAAATVVTAAAAAAAAAAAFAVVRVMAEAVVEVAVVGVHHQPLVASRAA
jgi:hypothetical protein